MTPQQAMIVDAFNSQVYIANTMDVQHTPLYDTVTIAASNPLSVLTSALFTNVGASSGKTLALTNLTQSQKLTIELQTRQTELQSTNEELATKAKQLAEQNVEVERKNKEEAILVGLMFLDDD